MGSQGGMPDQSLSIWKWQNESLVARKTAPATKHYQLAFAHDHTKITSCGKTRNKFHFRKTHATFMPNGFREKPFLTFF